MTRSAISICLQRIPNPFALTLVASKRSRQLARGAKPLIPADGHNATVVALDEIAAGLIDARVLDEPDPPAPLPIWLEQLKTLDPADDE